MAAVRRCRDLLRSLRPILWKEGIFTKQPIPRRSLYMIAAASGCTLAIHWFYKQGQAIVPVVHARETEKDEPPKERVTHREMRFRQFASVEYQGNIYMTPQDFLESVTEECPRPRIGRVKLAAQDVEGMLRQTPSRSRGSNKLFRNLHDKGIISYTEYLFLLCVLTSGKVVSSTVSKEPRSGFRIAFNMFDTDGNQIVDKKEFLVLERVFSKQPDSEDGEGRKMEAVETRIQDTSLMIHFFGKYGKDVLKYDDFHRFMENLQSEVIELEFLEFSKGMNTISEVDFAHILLRYTLLDRTEIDECIARVKDRIQQEKGITFQEFKKFCQFLNNLDDFSIAMKMYTYAQQPVSQDEFQRAVRVCTGFTLGKDVVNTVFQIFDSDGDGHLSSPEFISIMKDRLHRGSRSHLMHTQGNWEAFRQCIRNEMKSN
ncbi:calcium uptake protein 3, mitochondrial-like isoform X7 [Haliotis rufescens]|uniref:calcium uptake protein 3, mitochondrial-like isoform X7 n=1 Tax=Haliotis rufescens TaxID=6454 RepID=UPI001EAFEDFA|nr:calcium uptake protein 3, mitochondrial-like isoform X7 [Haliotis rufescens]